MTSIGVFAAVSDREGRYLCVRANYGERDWSMPGGQLEPGEDPIACIRREVAEETGAGIEISHLVGVYSAPYRDDLVLLFAATLAKHEDWTPTAEISEIGFFPLEALPSPMAPNPLRRFADVAAGLRGVTRTFSSPGIVEPDPSASSR